MAKKNCKVDRETAKEDAAYVCKKCGRIARKEKHLCKPKEIKK